MELIQAETLTDEARIWIYQADRILNEQEVGCITKKLENWLKEWHTHGKTLYSEAWVENQVFLIFAVDESLQPASGCSIDQSVHLIRKICNRVNVDFFDRMNFAYQDEDGAIRLTNDKELPRLYELGRIQDDTLFYDTTLDSKGAWKSRKLVPLKESWHRRFL